MLNTLLQIKKYVYFSSLSLYNCCIYDLKEVYGCPCSFDVEYIHVIFGIH